MGTRFATRSEAGQQLGARLASSDRDDVVVLGLPRGGVPVAAEVARALDAPLDVFIVRKLGVPGHAELAFGAVASGGVEVHNDDIISAAHIDRAVMRDIADAETAEVARREETLRGGRPPVELADRTVILVDDGVATGATMVAAIAGVRAHKPRSVVAAAPVAPPEVVDRMADAADEVVVLMTPAVFTSVGGFYNDFSQLRDEEVVEILRANDQVS
jgi:putative phosphoribosyl transferase